MSSPLTWNPVARGVVSLSTSISLAGPSSFGICRRWWISRKQVHPLVSLQGQACPHHQLSEGFIVCIRGFPKSLDKGDWSQMTGFSLQKSAQICTKCKLPSSPLGLMIEPKLISLNISQVLPVHTVWWNRHLIWELTTWKVKQLIPQQEKPKGTGLPVKKWWATGPGGGAEQWSPTSVAPGTGFMEDSVSREQRWWVGGWFWDDSSAWRLLRTLFQLLLYNNIILYTILLCIWLCWVLVRGTWALVP